MLWHIAARSRARQPCRACLCNRATAQGERLEAACQLLPPHFLGALAHFLDLSVLGGYVHLVGVMYTRSGAQGKVVFSQLPTHRRLGSFRYQHRFGGGLLRTEGQGGSGRISQQQACTRASPHDTRIVSLPLLSFLRRTLFSPTEIPSLLDPLNPECCLGPEKCGRVRRGVPISFFGGALDLAAAHVRSANVLQVRSRMLQTRTGLPQTRVNLLQAPMRLGLAPRCCGRAPGLALRAALTGRWACWADLGDPASGPCLMHARVSDVTSHS